MTSQLKSSYNRNQHYNVSHQLQNDKSEDYESNQYVKKQSTFGKIINKFKHLPNKIFTARQVRENKEFKETKLFQEGNDFVHMSRNFKNKISGEEIIQEISIKGSKQYNNYDYDANLSISEFSQKNKIENTQRNTQKYKSKKKCRYGSNCRNKKCKFNHSNNNHSNNNQIQQKFHENNFCFDENFATSFFST